MKIFDTIIDILNQSGISIELESIPGQAHEMHYYRCNDITNCVTTAIENLHRQGFNVETSNVGDFFTLSIPISNKQSKLSASFAFEYGTRTKGEYNDPIVLIAIKRKKVST